MGVGEKEMKHNVRGCVCAAIRVVWHVWRGYTDLSVVPQPKRQRFNRRLGRRQLPHFLPQFIFFEHLERRREKKRKKRKKKNESIAAFNRYEIIDVCCVAFAGLSRWCTVNTCTVGRRRFPLNADIRASWRSSVRYPALPANAHLRPC